MILRKKISLTFFGRIMSVLQNILSHVYSKPFMIYGYFNKKNGHFMRQTRISSTATLRRRENIDIDNYVYIYHYSVIDGYKGVKIGKGTQIGSWVGIFTHSAHMSIRLLGENFMETPIEERRGYIIGGVEIGEFTFVGPHSLILPGVKIGKGCIIGAGSIVRTNIPDYAIIEGSRAKKIGDTRKIDKAYFGDNIVQKFYYDQNVTDTIEAPQKNAWKMFHSVHEKIKQSE